MGPMAAAKLGVKMAWSFTISLGVIDVFVIEIEFLLMRTSYLPGTTYTVQRL